MTQMIRLARVFSAHDFARAFYGAAVLGDKLHITPEILAEARHMKFQIGSLRGRPDQATKTHAVRALRDFLNTPRSNRDAYQAAYKHVEDILKAFPQSQPQLRSV